MTCFGRSFEEGHPELFGECCALLCADHLFVKTVCLIPDQHFLYILTGMQLYLSDPVPHVIEAFFHRAIISQYNAHGPFIVSLRYGPEALLPRSVPNLELHIFAINLNRFDLKVDSYKEKQNPCQYSPDIIIPFKITG